MITCYYRADKKQHHAEQQDDEEEQFQAKLAKQRELKEKDAEEVAKQKAERNKLARLQLKFADGSNTSNTFDSSNKLTDVIEWIDQVRDKLAWSTFCIINLSFSLKVEVAANNLFYSKLTIQIVLI